jgi:hypothetical protein
MRDLIGWKVIREEDDFDRMHIVPFNVNADTLMLDHSLIEKCSCHPRLEECSDSTLIIHNMIH